MMKRIVTKNGVLFVQESALNNEYTADKLNAIIEATKTKPLNKLTSIELSALVKTVLGKDVSPSKCVSCSRNRWITLLKSYQDVCTKILEIKDKEKIEAFEAEQTNTETTETETDTDTETTDTEEKTTEDKEDKPVEKEETKPAKKGKGGKK